MPTALSARLRRLKEQGMTRKSRREGTKSRKIRLAQRAEARKANNNK